MRCRIEKMAQGGRGLARIDGKVVFVAGALPGELVDIVFTKQRKDFGEANTIQVVESHPERIAPSCPAYGRCGGCDLQYASVAGQREGKRQVVDDLFRRMAKTELPPDWILQGGAPWAYRGRARLVRARQGWGFRAANSHDVIPLSTCPVLAQALQGIFANPNLPRLSYESELQVIVDGEGQLGFWHESMREPDLLPQTWVIEGKKLQADARVFFQSNVEMMTQLIRVVQKDMESLTGSRNLAVDLFSGVGVFAAFLQDVFAKVVAVEWNEGCLRHARVNLGPRCEFMSRSAEDYLAEQIPQGIDYLVVDPPRAGLSPEVRAALLQARPRRMAYVSCDPVTLARDVGEFVRNGWTLELVEGFDFYPQTHHLEMLAILS